MNIILASGSPRRQELLNLITDDFSIEVSDVEEIVPDNISSADTAEYLASLKAQSVAENHPNDLVIGCDTVVVADNSILGKPADNNQCREYLNLLSGRTHTVITGCCLVCGDKKKSFSVSTEVTFRDLSDSEISAYITTGEPFDKAGGYGIQGKGCLLVDKINGDYFNVVGLPVSRLNLEIIKFKERLL